jgi:Na+/melibiose symporter-like transporter
MTGPEAPAARQDASAGAAPRAIPAPAPARVKLLSGFTGGVDSLVFIGYELFILFYYNQILGLPATMTGVAILISMIIDAITDPIVGSWSDNLRSRFGRRHAFMFGSILPLGLTIWLLFSPPAGLGETGLLAWLIVMSVAVRVTLTFFAMPASAVLAEISPLKKDRAEMGIARQIFGSAGQYLLLWMAFSVFFVPTPEFPNGQENAAAYPPFALAFAIVIMSFMLIGSTATYRRIREHEAALGERPHTSFNLMKALREWGAALARFPNFRAILLGLFLAGLTGSTHRSLSLYLGTYLWELTPAQIKEWQQITIIGTFALALAARFFISKLDPKIPYISAFVLLKACILLPPLLSVLGLFPAAGSPALVTALLGFNLVVGACYGTIMVASAVMFSEITDEYHYVTRISQTGMIFGLITFGNKAASGLGKVISGSFLELSHFPSKDRMDLLTPEIMAKLVYMLSGYIFLFAVIGFIVLNTYRLTRARHDEILRGLEEMKAKQA